MGDPAGFDWQQRKNSDVVITHDGRHATVLRGSAAERFADAVAEGDPQAVMARVTGKYKRGNERRTNRRRYAVLPRDHSGW